MKYEISKPGETAKMVATYEGGQLHALEGIHHLSSLWKSWAINAPVPIMEEDMPRCIDEYDGILLYRQVKLSKVDEKIAAFCAKYKKVYGKKYIKNTADVTAIRPVPMTEQLLELYFHNNEWWGKQPKSLRNYAKNYNALQQLIANPRQKKKGIDFPDGYDPSFERKLKGAQMQQYWKHLRSLGLKPKKTQTGKTIDWVKAGVLLLVALLLGSCLTDRRVQNYLAEHPEIIDTRTDTVLKINTIAELDTIYTPMREDKHSWWWTWGGENPDSIKSEGEWIEVVVTGQDTTVEQEEKTRFEVVTRVKKDTLYIRDTILVPQTTVRTNHVIVRNSWKEKAIWAGIGAALMMILILILWRRRR